MDVLITAGGTPAAGEKLYEYARGAPKAMINIAGKPMVQWVLDAVSRSSHVDHIVLIGLRELGGLTCPKPLTLMPNQARYDFKYHYRHQPGQPSKSIRRTCFSCCI